MKIETCFGVMIWFALLAVIAGASQISLESEKYVDVPFLSAQHDSRALVFFGFKKCHGVCPTTMLSLQKFYLSGKSNITLPRVLFVDIDRGSNSILAQEYAKNFHADFQGYFPSDNEFKHISDEFGLNVMSRGDEIRHRGYLYYLKREGERWKIAEVLPPQLVSVELLKGKFL